MAVNKSNYSPAETQMIMCITRGKECTPERCLRCGWLRDEIKEKLEPIDSKRCQAEVKGGSFMTFGLRKFVRCKNKPTYIAVSVEDGRFCGAMSLCDECQKVCEIRMPNANFQELV